RAHDFRIGMVLGHAEHAFAIIVRHPVVTFDQIAAVNAGLERGFLARILVVMRRDLDIVACTDAHGRSSIVYRILTRAGQQGPAVPIQSRAARWYGHHYTYAQTMLERPASVTYDDYNDPFAVLPCSTGRRL